MVRIRTLAASAAAAALLVPGTAGAAAAAGAPPRTFAFLSHAAGVERERLLEFGPCIDVVAPNWYELRAPGARIAPREPDADILAMSRGAGAGVWPVVNAQLGGGEALARHRIRAKIARRVAGIARRYSYAGMTLDLEDIDPSTGPAFTRLVRQTARRLGRERRKLAVYVPRRTSAPPGNWAAPYNWRALSRHADLVLASGYNEHYAGGAPGPVTTSAGFREVLDYAASVSRRKVAPTIAGFGYHWPRAGGPAQLIAAASATANPLTLVYGAARDGALTYPTATGTVWTETAEGMRARAGAAGASGFRWLGLFSLGREPREFWAGCG